MRFRLSIPEHWPVYLLGSLIVLLVLITVFGERGVLHLWRLYGEENRLNEQNYRLQQENQALRQRVYRIRNDNAYLEKLAREELNLVRPGDIVYRFPGSEKHAAAPDPAPRDGAKSRRR